MKKSVQNFLTGMGSLLEVYPDPSISTPELRRFMTPPKSVEEAFLADANALQKDWQRVGTSLQKAFSGLSRVERH
ncbi:hypothetical protein [Candidatus Magnetaquicoccus inordinatus]|uniref:hypothetical protein n=1 Tax=Candidatus Magnetaquicoccus inordinatus TaxID=2496818 RepID=UPI00102CCFA9|nr:hypothetical protein [Candidatus Magnetaquicoccus inordinatus]